MSHDDKYSVLCDCGEYVELSNAWWHRSVCRARSGRAKVVADMVETVARALAVEEGVEEHSWQAMTGHARAAIDAVMTKLRSPTIVMIGAGATAGATSNDAAVAVWQAMIEKAAER